MKYLTDVNGEFWRPSQAPQGSPIPLGAYAKAWYLGLADAWQWNLGYGAPPNPVLTGDLPTSSGVSQVRLVVPAKATHAEVLVYAAGAGIVHVQESGAAHAAEIPCQGKASAGVTAEDALTFASGASYPSVVAAGDLRMVALPDGASPFYTVDLDIWKTEDPRLIVYGVSFRFTRLASTIT